MQYFITKQKLKELEIEYEHLKKMIKDEIAKEVPSLLESGDLNPDFTSYEEVLEQNQNRLEEIENILKNHQIIKKPPKEERDKIFLGANVVLRNDKHKTEYKIVGTLEANPFEGKISDESPAGKAFLGKTVGEVVSVGPAQATYQILEINYEDA
ncbi:GreA/GreB family elongation factor [bacterium]|nr:GreA/GreB family elongation factor [bacterium]